MPERRPPGKGIGFDEAGNTSLTIRLEINGQVVEQITAVNVGKTGLTMNFESKNRGFEFNHLSTTDYSGAFRKMFTELNNGRS